MSDAVKPLSDEEILALRGVSVDPRGWPSEAARQETLRWLATLDAHGGWLCFYCGKRYLDEPEARAHFKSGGEWEAAAADRAELRRLRAVLAALEAPDEAMEHVALNAFNERQKLEGATCLLGPWPRAAIAAAIVAALTAARKKVTG